MMGIKNVGWLLIGIGLGITLSKEEIWLILFGISLLITGVGLIFFDDWNIKQGASG